MTSFASLRPLAGPGIHIDLAAMECPMKVALRRAAVFLGYAVRSTEHAPLASVSLNAAIELDVGVPDPLPVGERVSYQEQFRGWAIGQGLIELDQNYHRFIVSALETAADIAEFQRSRSLAGPHKPNLSNTWAVHESFYSSVGDKSAQHDEEASHLRSLGNARNCLAHDSGIVTARRLTEADRMPVRWRGRDMYQTLPTGGRRLVPRDQPYVVRAEDVGCQLAVEEVTRERTYREGERVEFSPTDLSEIIFFYQLLAMQVSRCMHRFVAEAGRQLNR